MQLIPSKLFCLLAAILSSHCLRLLTLPQGNLTEGRTSHSYLLLSEYCRKCISEIHNLIIYTHTYPENAEKQTVHTCGYTLGLVGSADFPSLSTRAHVRSVSRFAELGAALVRVHHTQGLVWKQKWKVTAGTDRSERRLLVPFSQWTPVKPDLQTQS